MPPCKLTSWRKTHCEQMSRDCVPLRDHRATPYRMRSLAFEAGPKQGDGVRVRRSRCAVRVIALRPRADDRRDPIVDVDEAVERSALALDHCAKRVPVELHVGEVLEQDVVRLVAFTLELLAGEGRPMGPGELVDRIADHDPDV